MRANLDHFHPGIPLYRILVVALLALEVFIVLGEANPLTTAMGRDSGMYTYVSSQLLHGRTPYVNAWEHKPPAIFFIDAAALLLGGGSRWGLYAMEAAFLLGAAVAGFAALKTIFGPGPAMLASVVWLGALSRLLQGGNLTEEYALLFSFVSLWMFTRILQRDLLWQHVVLGLAFGCGLLTRPNNSGVQLAILGSQALLVAFRQRALGAWLRGLMATAVGFLIPLAAVSAFFGARHAFPAFVEAGFIYNMYYAGQPDFIGSLLGGLGNLGFLAYVALAGMALAYYRLWAQIKARTIHAITLWMCLDCVLEIYFSGLSGRNYVHYFIDWLPWMAFAFGLLASTLFPAAANWAYRFPARTALIAMEVVAIVSMPTLAAYARSFVQPTPSDDLQRQDAVVRYVEQHTRPDQTVLVWSGEAAINFLAGRQAPTAQFQYGIYVASNITDRLSAEFLGDLQRHPPALIVDPLRGRLPPLSVRNPVAWSKNHGVYPQPYMQQVFELVHRNYDYAGLVGGMQVYALDR
jgi:hypothetical protein